MKIWRHTYLAASILQCDVSTVGSAFTDAHWALGASLVSRLCAHLSLHNLAHFEWRICTICGDNSGVTSLVCTTNQPMEQPTINSRDVRDFWWVLVEFLGAVWDAIEMMLFFWWRWNKHTLLAIHWWRHVFIHNNTHITHARIRIHVVQCPAVVLPTISWYNQH